MAYCPKCGVEVEKHIKSCPLCSFPIPDIRRYDDEGHWVPLGNVDDQDQEQQKFPVADNIYNEERLRIKNQIFMVMITVFISGMIVLTAIKSVYPVSESVISLIFIGLVSAFLYLFFLIGYFKGSVNIIGLGVTTLFLTYGIDHANGISWFFTYALPLTLYVYGGILGMYLVIKRTPKKSRLAYLPTAVLLVFAILSLAVNGVITYNLYGQVNFTWSIIVALSCGGVIIIINAIFNVLPRRHLETLKRKLHM